MLGHDLEELDGELPMSGEFLRHDGGKSREVDLLALDEVHEPGEIGGKLRGLCRA